MNDFGSSSSSHWWGQMCLAEQLVYTTQVLTFSMLPSSGHRLWVPGSGFGFVPCSSHYSQQGSVTQLCLNWARFSLLVPLLLPRTSQFTLLKWTRSDGLEFYNRAPFSIREGYSENRGQKSHWRLWWTCLPIPPSLGSHASNSLTVAVGGSCYTLVISFACSNLINAVQTLIPLVELCAWLVPHKLSSIAT